MIGTFNTDDPMLQVEFNKARQLLVDMHETRRFGLRKRVVGARARHLQAVQIVLVERLT